MTTEEAVTAYGAVSDVAQMLLHVDSYTDELLLIRVRALSKCHAKTLFNLSESSIFDALPKATQLELEATMTFCPQPKQ